MENFLQPREFCSGVPHTDISPAQGFYSPPSSRNQHLLILHAPRPRLLRHLHTFLIRLRVPLPHPHQPPRRLPRPLQVPHGRFPKQMDLDQVALEGAFERDDALDEEGVGVAQVEMHKGHHADAHELGFPQGAQLRVVVGVDGGGNEFGFVGGAHGGGFDVFEGGEVCVGIGLLGGMCLLRVLCEGWGGEVTTFLLVDFLLQVEIHADDEEVRNDVKCAHAHEDLGVVEGDLFGDLHHAEDDHQVSAGIGRGCQQFQSSGGYGYEDWRSGGCDVHLRIEAHHD